MYCSLCLVSLIDLFPCGIWIYETTLKDNQLFKKPVIPHHETKRLLLFSWCDFSLTSESGKL